MKLSKGAKTLLGIITFLPLILGVILVMLTISSAMAAIKSGNSEAMSEYLMSNLSLFIGLGSIMMFLSTVVFIVYLIHVLKNKHLTDVMKLIWVLLQFFFNPVAHIVYFFMEIVRDEDLEPNVKMNDREMRM